jgi:hypothetical protein
VYGWFTEGFDTLDLKEAKALLDERSPIEVGRARGDARGRGRLEQVRQRRPTHQAPSWQSWRASWGGDLPSILPRSGGGGAADRYCSSQSRKNGFFWPGVAAGLPCASNPVFAMVSCDVGSAVDASEATGPGGGALKAADAG